MSNSKSIDVGDVILAVNNKDVDTEADFLAAIADNKVGDTIALVIDRSVGSQDGKANKRKNVTINMRLSK